MLYTHKRTSLCCCPMSLPLLHSTTEGAGFWTLVVLPFSLDAYETDFAWQVPDSGDHMSALERKSNKSLRQFSWEQAQLQLSLLQNVKPQYPNLLYHNVRTKKVTDVLDQTKGPLRSACLTTNSKQQRSRKTSAEQMYAVSNKVFQHTVYSCHR